MTNSACLNFHAHFPDARLRNLTIHQLPIPTCSTDLRCFHIHLPLNYQDQLHNNSILCLLCLFVAKLKSTSKGKLMPTLFDPLRVGNIQLDNRIVMAPLTRSRANDEGVQPSYAAVYYSQRASAGLI